MAVSVTFHHVTPVPSVQRYVTERLERIVRRSPSSSAAHMIIDAVESEHDVEIVTAVDGNHVLVARAIRRELPAAIDATLAQLEEEARRWLAHQRAG